jgi:hypothetical protein
MRARGEGLDAGAYYAPNLSAGGQIQRLYWDASESVRAVCAEIWEPLGLDFYAVDCLCSDEKVSSLNLLEVNSNPAIGMTFRYSEQEGERLVDLLVRRALDEDYWAMSREWSGRIASVSVAGRGATEPIREPPAQPLRAASSIDRPPARP